MAYYQIMADNNKQMNYTPWQKIVSAMGFQPDTRAGGMMAPAPQDMGNVHYNAEGSGWVDPEVQKRMEAIRRGAGYR